MTKVQKISKNITPFAGVFFVNDEFNRSWFRKLIDNQLGVRVSTNGYSYGNLFGNFFNLFLSGGEFVEDIQQHFRSTLEQIPSNKVVSADTLLRCFSELARRKYNRSFFGQERIPIQYQRKTEISCRFLPEAYNICSI